MERAGFYIGVVDDIGLVVPIREAVFQRRRKGDKRYDCDNAATVKTSSDVVPCRLLPVAIQVV